MANHMPPTGDQQKITKGKPPRNALLGVGLVAAVVIGAMGFYYQLQETRQAEQEAKELKAQKAADAVTKTPQVDDVDKMISDQQASARRAAAEQRARVASDAAASRAPATLTAENFVSEEHTQQIARDSSDDALYTAPIFKPGVKVKETAGQAQGVGALNPAQMLLEQNAAEQHALAAAQAQAGALAAAGPSTSASTLGKSQDLKFLKDTRAQSESGDGFKTTGFVGQARGCTLSPPHHISVRTIEASNSDRPGTIGLWVDEDVYDSLRGDCLMIPRGTTITAPYSSDIQPGQESLLVAATEMRLPNGKQVPLDGAPGADPNGYNGFSAHVNNHFLKIYGTSFLTAILVRRFDNTDTSTTTNALGVTQVGSTAGQVAATTAQSVLNRYQNIQPTLTTKIGEHFMLKVAHDLRLEPYVRPETYRD